MEAPEPFVDVVQGEGIEAYLTPCGKQQTGIALLWDPAVYRHAQKGRGLFASLVAAFPQLERSLAGAVPLSEPICYGPMHRLARRRATDGILLLGDAGGYIDACTGEGISIALAQALALEKTVVPALKQTSGLLTLRRLTSYVEACRHITRPYKIGTRLQLYLCRHPRLANRIVRAMASNDDLASRWLAANMGRASFWPGWKAGLRLVKSVASGA
jgi:flavin-dependent dehydrogenase